MGSERKKRERSGEDFIKQMSRIIAVDRLASKGLAVLARGLLTKNFIQFILTQLYFYDTVRSISAFLIIYYICSRQNTCTVLCCTILLCTALAVLYCTALHCTAPTFPLSCARARPRSCSDIPAQLNRSPRAQLSKMTKYSHDCITLMLENPNRYR